MKQRSVLFTFLVLSIACKAQIYSTKDGIAKFVSEAPLEVIRAESDELTGLLDIGAKSFAFSVDIETFEGFNSALQREHFRENYMEIDKYPKATFKGKIMDEADLKKNGTYFVRSKGMLNIHGMEKEKIIKVKLTVKDKTIQADCDFEVPLEDHNIKIPKVVNQKIASVINVSVKAALKPKS
jgi:polyisoprenoid-binding protein YceI